MDCPHCGKTIETKQKKAIKDNIVCYISKFGKPVYYSKNMQSIIAARKEGSLITTKDWLPAYLKAMPKQHKIRDKLMLLESQLSNGEINIDTYNEAESELKKARLELNRKVFN